MDAKLTGKFIRRKRKELGLSQLELSRLVYVEPQTVSKWERGISMPDYDKLDALKSVFHCTLSDILEPEIVENEIKVMKDDGNFSGEDATDHQLVATILDENNNKSDNNSKESSRLKLSDLFSRKRLGKKVAASLGCQYEDVYNEKFLFKEIFKKRKRQDYEETFTQGMFKDNINRTVLGISAPWLYARAFLLLAVCTILALCVSIMTMNPILYIVLGGLCGVVPLTLFLFESNFSRDISILQVIKLFLLGGLFSMLLLFIIEPIGNASEVVSAVIVAPIFEEIAKFTIAVIFVAIIKPKNLISGLLIGFAVGGGFDVFETYHYGINEFLIGILSGQNYEDGFMLSILTITSRTISSFLSGHHYFTGIATAVYVLFKRDTKFHIKEVFSWRTMSALVVSMLLHATWNGASFLGAFVSPILHLVVDFICVTAFIILINIGIAEYKVISIFENEMDDTYDGGDGGNTFKEEPIIN